MKLRSGDYELWIKENVSVAYGKCSKVTEMMVAEFPELKRVRGYYHCPIWGKREHWWLVDTEGEIVDPTVSQFPSGGFGEYEPWVEGSPEPTGMCPNCGEACYNGDSVCSEKCHQEYVAYLNKMDYFFWVTLVLFWTTISWFIWQIRRIRKLHKELLGLQRLTIEWIKIQQKFFEAVHNSKGEVAEHWFVAIQEIEAKLIKWNK